MKIIRLFALLVFVISACAAPTPTLAPTIAAPTLVSPTATAPNASATSPAPTASPAPSATSTTDARQQEQAAILPLVSPCNFANQPIFYSPSKRWVVVTCQGAKAEDGSITKIARADGLQQWSISFKDTYLTPYRKNDPNPGSLLQKAFTPVRWTKSEDFVYLAIQTAEEKTPFRGYDGLYRIDLASGKSHATLKPAAAPASIFYDFKFSPDGTKLASINSSVKPVNIVIADTGTGQESTISLDARFTKGGGLLWSDNGSQLVVSALDESKNGGDAVIIYDLANMQNRYIVKGSATVYQPAGWLGSNLIYAESNRQGWVYIDLLSGTVSTAPAPTPAP